MKKDKVYALTGLWALFVSLLNTGRKYFEYKNGGDERMTEWKVLGLHFLGNFGVFLLIGILLVLIYFKFIKR